MRFEWDEKKNRINIRTHGFDFADAWEIFEAQILSSLDTREDYGEDRWIAVGSLKGRVVVVVFTERGEDTIRIFSLRKALKHERTKYEQAIKDQLGSN